MQGTNDKNNGNSFSFPPYMNVDHHQHQAAAPAVTTTHEPLISQSQQTEFMFSHPNNNCLAADDWTLKEHELFMKGLSKYEIGDWNKIASHYLNNKTPQQVQSYANNFFYNSFGRRRNSSPSIYSPSSSTASFRTYSSGTITIVMSQLRNADAFS
ncbi:hypothetical protein PIB30_064617 [Stylosanthes scabra]|uniref:Uncharacterized protein n=1 Tax=Stylosanthes scabra TaxID=79078 RepID=A0ABU6SLR2_9FABA|nr:hypothetical protein [Stylosanthes scabra]